MSQLTAHTVLPLFKALPPEEQQAFLQIVSKLDSPKPKVKTKKKKSVYDTMPAIFHPDNREQLVSEIMYGSES